MVTDQQEALEKAIKALTAAIGAAEDRFLAAVQASGLTARQMNHLEAIHRLGNPNPGEIARRLRLSKPSVTAIITKLEGLGFLRKAATDEDRRGYHVHPTGKAKRLVREHADIHRRLAEMFIACLSAEEISALSAMMDKIIKEI